MRLKEQLNRVKEFYDEFNRVYQRFNRGQESIYSVERLAELIAQSLLDLAAMIVASERGTKPETYGELMTFLAKRAGLNEEVKDYLIGLVGFRNILIHGYAKLNRKLELEAFKEMLEKASTVTSYLERLVSRDPTVLNLGEELKNVLRKWGVEYAILFGSLARKGQGKDIDIALKVKLKSGIELGKLLTDVAEALKVKEDDVDIVLLDDAPLGLLKTIIDEGVIIYGDESKALDYLSSAYIRLLDWLETLRFAENFLKNGKRSSTIKVNGS